MNIDETDINLLMHFLTSPAEYFTVVEVVKNLFQPKTRTELTNHVSLINYRLSKWVEQGIFKVKTKRKVRRYCLRKNAVLYGDSTLIIGDHSVKAGKAIAVKSKNDNYLSVCFFAENNV